MDDDTHACEECGDWMTYEASVDAFNNPVGGWYCYTCGRWENDPNVDPDNETQPT